MRSAPGRIYIVFHSFLKETTNACPQWAVRGHILCPSGADVAREVTCSVGRAKITRPLTAGRSTPEDCR
jgi:hypothetical protein